ncbi:hypothetical protein ACP275_02G149900 [Erythranthe tilingii]
MPMQLPYHQPQVPVQFGGQNLQIQPQAMPGPPMPMPMPMSVPIGNLPVQHPMYVPGLQPHHMQPQGMMHQGQSLTFPPQMGAQHPSQLGSMGMNPASACFPAVSSVPINTTQVPPTSQIPRPYKQVTVKSPVGSHGEKEVLPPTGSLSGGKAESLKPSRLPEEGSIFPGKEIGPSSLSTLPMPMPKPKPGLGTSYATVASSSPVVVDRVVPHTSVSASDPMDGSASASTTTAEARSASGLVEEDKWNKFPGPVMSGRGDIRTDVGHMNNIAGLRPGQGVNYGILRNLRAQTPAHYAGPILTGPLQFGPQGGPLQRNNSDSDRWQRATGFQKGLMPPPQTPMQIMHKAEKKYDRNFTDEEQAKQRQLKGILNKLTPQNFEKLFEQVKQVNIDNVITLSGVISQIFDKALMEPTFCEVYPNLCFHLAAVLPDLSVDNEKITFKRLLLNKCQEEFERGEREEEEANKAEEEGEVKQTAEEREEKRLQVRRRMLGNIRLIGELYKKRMLTERIMHECINKLLGQYHNPDEENIEALCKLMSTIGEMIDHPKAKEFMDAYFDIMAQLSNNMKLSSRVRFMLKDSIDLRKNKWQQRRKVEGPKRIDVVHRDAAQERHAQASRLARVPSMGNSARRGPPMEFAPRSSNMLSPPSSQIGGFRGVPMRDIPLRTGPCPFLCLRDPSVRSP